MNNYDFTRLNDKEFEDLVIDLISAENPNTQIERFMPGRDSGMDGRFYTDSNNVIIQSKHYIKSNYSSLIKNLKLEAPKVTSLNPSRYILAICQGLTNIRKNEIIKIFGSQYLRYVGYVNKLLLRLQKYSIFMKVMRSRFFQWLFAKNIYTI
nr:restriction endonuclease [Providencia rettgeri]